MDSAKHTTEPSMEEDESIVSDFEQDDVSNHANDEDNASDAGSMRVVKKELNSMNIARTFMYCVLISFATISAEVVFILIQFQEESVYYEQHRLLASRVIDNFYEQVDSKAEAAQELATALTIQTAHDNWPFVSFEEFDWRCSHVRQLAQASSISFLPVVMAVERNDWEVYARYAEATGVFNSSVIMDSSDSAEEQAVSFYDSGRTLQGGIFRMENGTAVSVTDVSEVTMPLWQLTPFPEDAFNQTVEVRMFDALSNPVRSSALKGMAVHQGPVLSEFLIGDSDGSDIASFYQPSSSLYVPVYDADPKVVGALDLSIPWKTFLEGALDKQVPASEVLVVVVESQCPASTGTQEHSFRVNSKEALYLGPGALYDKPLEDHFEPPRPINSTYDDFASLFTGMWQNPGSIGTNATSVCPFRLRVYSTPELEAVYMTVTPEIYRWIVLGMFMTTILVFLVYDCIIEKRANAVVEEAKQTDALVSALFPSDVKRRLLENAKAQAEMKKKRELADEEENKLGWKIDFPVTSVDGSIDGMNDDGMDTRIHTPKRRLKSFLEPGGSAMDAMTPLGTEPIADLFLNASVMFADISGFTAWSSEREPSQVFTLLETLYNAMDRAARRLKVFKVETIGDCYVAACGLPQQRDDHAEALVRFARMCLLKSNKLVKSLEITLGPGTAELALRFGIHSGPVTAGVLRGEKARFQLFGDTMNMAARMESTGMRNKIQLSEATVALLKARNKGHWVRPREEKVHAKGKGELQTYWLVVGSKSGGSVSGRSSTCSGSVTSDDNSVSSAGYHEPQDTKFEDEGMTPVDKLVLGVIGQNKVSSSLKRLVEWNTSALMALLEKVVLSRGSDQLTTNSDCTEMRIGTKTDHNRDYTQHVEMFIALPDHDHDMAARVYHGKLELPSVVRTELRDYIMAIASGYRNNPFHNFEHCSHVILSATKLLKRISYADGLHGTEDTGASTEDVHNFTFGISTDPLLQFAVVFSALVHDVGHSGVPNHILAAEEPEVAERYGNRCLAEQRSVEVALELLMLPKYAHLRACICGTPEEQRRFRQLAINCVLATDIFEKDLKNQRQIRWDQAFDASKTEHTSEDRNRKATIVLEHIIQASDVSHTMQHWHIYLKWNERLFCEMYEAFLDGRSGNDPSEGWYKGEIWFFDNYVIPLAKKLKQCGVFGVSSDEYLTYAVHNRNEWEQRGEEVCRAMKERFLQKRHEKEQKRRKIEVVEEGVDESERSDNSTLKPVEA